jgi:hypothetical protein
LSSKLAHSEELSKAGFGARLVKKGAKGQGCEALADLLKLGHPALLASTMPSALFSPLSPLLSAALHSSALFILF